MTGLHFGFEMNPGFTPIIPPTPAGTLTVTRPSVVAPWTGNLVVVAGCGDTTPNPDVGGRIYIIDFSDPNNPVVVSQTPEDIRMMFPTDILIIGNYCYVTDETTGISTYDLSSGTPVRIGTWPAVNFPTAMSQLDSQHFLVARRIDDRINTMSIATPGTPVSVGVVGSFGHADLDSITCVAAFGGQYAAFLGATNNKFGTVRYPTPSTPAIADTIVGATNQFGTSFGFVLPDLPYCYAVHDVTASPIERVYFSVINVNDPLNITLTTSTLFPGVTTTPKGIVKVDDVVWVGGSQTLTSFLVSDPTNPKLIQTFTGITYLTHTVIAVQRPFCVKEINGVKYFITCGLDRVAAWLVPPTPTELTPAWTRDDRYYESQTAFALPNAHVGHVVNYSGGLIADYGKLANLVTWNVEGPQAVITLPTLPTRTRWEPYTVQGSQMAIVGMLYDNNVNGGGTYPARLYDMSDPQNPVLTHSKNVGNFSGTSVTSVPIRIWPGNVLVYPRNLSGTHYIVGSDFDSASLVTHGPFSLSHQVFFIAGISPPFTISGTTYGLAFGTTSTFTVFTLSGVVTTGSLGLSGAGSPQWCTVVVNGATTYVVLGINDAGTFKIARINVTTPSSPSVFLVTPSDPTGSRGLVGVDGNEFVVAGFVFPDSYWEWWNVGSMGVTRRLDDDPLHDVSGGVLLDSGAIAAIGGVGGYAFIENAKEAPTPLKAPGPKPWLTVGPAPVAGLGSPVILWDSRSYDGGGTLFNEGTGGNAFDLTVSASAGGSWAWKKLNWPTGVASLGPNLTPPTWAMLGGKYDVGPATMIYALPPGHLNANEWTEFDFLPGNAGAYDVIGLSIQGFNWDGGFAAMSGLIFGDSLDRGTDVSLYLADGILDPLCNNNTNGLLVAITNDPAHSYHGAWVVDQDGVHTIFDQVTPYGNESADHYDITNSTHPNPEYDSQGDGSSSMELFMYFGVHNTTPPAQGTTWSGITWGALYRQRPTVSDLQSLYDATFP